MYGHNVEINGLSGGANAVVDTTNGSGLSTLTVGNGDATSSFGGVIRNSSGFLALLKTGKGTLILSGTDSFSGGTTVNAGTLVAASSTALPDGTSLTVGAGGTFVFDPSQAGAPITGSAIAAAGVAAVPEPSALMLLAAGMAMGLGVAWRRWKAV